MTTFASNPKCLNAVFELFGLESGNDVPTLSVPAHEEQGGSLEPFEITVYRQSVGGPLWYTQDRTDAQYEVSGRC